MNNNFGLNRKKALLLGLGVDLKEVENVTPSEWNDQGYEYEGEEYLVLTEEEANNATKEYIEDSVWSFSRWFLSDMTGLDICVFEKLDSLCEDANEVVLALINSTCGLDEFVEEAIRLDGRGHFLNTWDGNEYEAEVEDTDYYIYRQ